jgi:predicted NAD/FAD-binding protein
MTRPTAAVIGAGVAGLTAAHLLQRRYDVTLFEADARLGGHAHTHEVVSSDGGTTFVDTGFIVHNERTYPKRRRRARERSGAGRRAATVALHHDGLPRTQPDGVVERGRRVGVVADDQP